MLRPLTFGRWHAFGVHANILTSGHIIRQPDGGIVADDNAPRLPSPLMDRPLFAPWRMEYIRSLEKPEEGCFLCACAKASTDDERAARFVLWQTELSVVLMNLFPYNNGHLLIAPRAHKAELETLTDAEQADVMLQTTECVRLLKRAVSAQGFNIGINLGKCAGAGLPGHLHQHVVPRWAGDTNFMGVVGEVRVVPQAIGQLYDELVNVRKGMKSAT